jgi:hypothetical protein
MTADSLSQQTTNLSILVGAIFVAFLCSILLISSTLFVSGIVISRFYVPLAGLMAAGFAWFLQAHTTTIQQQGIRFVEFSKLPSEEGKTRNLAYSRAIICGGN